MPTSTCLTTSSLMSPKATGGGSDTLAGSLGACLSWAGDQSQLRAWQPGSLPLPLPTPGMPQRPGGGGGGCLEDQLPWGGMVLIGSCFPRDPAPPFQGLPAKAPGCLGTFPNKYARAASLSGKHGLPLPPALLPSSLPALLSGNSVGPTYGLGVRTPWAQFHTRDPGPGASLCPP